MYTENYEQEIDLKDLFFALLYHWRLLLAAALAGAVVMGAVKAAGNPAAAVDAAAQQSYEEELVRFEDEKRTLELAIKNIEQGINAQYHYIAEAPSMQVDPYDEPIATADLMLELSAADTQGGLQGLLQAYQNAILNGGYLAALAQAQGIKTSYLREQISVSSNPAINPRAEMIVLQPEMEATRAILQLSVAGMTKETVEDVMSGILAETERVHELLDSEYGRHELKKIRQDVSTHVDLKLLEKQQDIRDYVTSLNRSRTELADRLDKMEEPEPIGAEAAMLSMKNLLKYIIIGFLAGGFVAAFCVCGVFVLNDKVTSDKEIKNRFAVKSLGVFSREPKRRAFDFIDRWLRHLEGTDVVCPEDSVYEMIVTNIQNYAGEKRMLFLTGFASPGRLEQVAGRLEKELPGYVFKTDGNVVANASARRTMAECEAVVLVEEIGVSRYSGIQKELEIVGSLKMDVVGMVLA